MRRSRKFAAFKIFASVGILLGQPDAVLALVPTDMTGNAKDTTEYIPYCMDSSYFSCDIPSGWSQSRDEEEDAEYRIYEILLGGPESDKVSVDIRVSYYAGDNEDFAGHADFIERNSKNILGETQNAREMYEPVKKTMVGKHVAFELARERMEYLHPQMKSDASAEVKEKLYVIPAADGFYVLHYSAPKTLFAKYLPVFEHIRTSFKARD